MTSKKRPEWKVKVYGRQVEQIDTDLMVQLVIMLGRQLAEETEEQNQTGGRRRQPTEED
jgi:hypothetical protein